MTRAERESLRTAFSFCCGYCGASETQTGSELTVDHFRPTARGGGDQADNWVYSCIACNGFKGAHFSDDEESSLLHPLRDEADLHWREENGQLIGLTNRGRFHIERLHLNRTALIANRRDRARTRGLETEIEAVREELRQEKENVARLENQIQELL